LYELQAAFHAAASHGGDIEAMMALWADDSSLTVGSVIYSGKDAVRTFFATQSGAFKHSWVSLAPSPKTQFEIHTIWRRRLGRPTFGRSLVYRGFFSLWSPSPSFSSSFAHLHHSRIRTIGLHFANPTVPWA